MKTNTGIIDILLLNCWFYICYICNVNNCIPRFFVETLNEILQITKRQMCVKNLPSYDINILNQNNNYVYVKHYDMDRQHVLSYSIRSLDTSIARFLSIRDLYPCVARPWNDIYYVDNVTIANSTWCHKYQTSKCKEMW